MVLTELLQHLSCTQGSRNDKRLLDYRLDIDITLTVKFRKELLHGYDTHKLVECLVAGEYPPVPGMQQIVDHRALLLRNIHPLHIGAVGHQVAGTFVGKVEDLLMDDILLLFDNSLL